MAGKMSAGRGGGGNLMGEKNALLDIQLPAGDWLRHQPGKTWKSVPVRGTSAGNVRPDTDIVWFME